MRLPVLDRPAVPSPAANCTFGRGCGDASPEPTADFAALVADHPCYSEEAHHHFARMHVAVAPACNVQCNYCNRKYDCANESRPGVVSERLRPEDAVRKVLAVAAEIPELSVVGIAGPGDALANPDATFATIEGVRRAAPDLRLCLSTNGLALPEHVERLARAGVRHVTVTVNMIDPAVGERIYPWVLRGGRKLRGAEGARVLSAQQLDGIARLARAGRAREGERGGHPRRERHAPARGRPRGPQRGGVHREPRPAHLRARARHALRPDRPARPDPRGARARPGGVRARRAAHAPLPSVPRGRGGPALRGPVRGVHGRVAPARADPGRPGGARGAPRRSRASARRPRPIATPRCAESPLSRRRSPPGSRSRRGAAARWTSTSATRASCSCTT